MTEVPTQPAPGSQLDSRAALARLGLGVLLILLAALVFAGSRYVAGHQHHAYDPDATPPASFQLTAGKVYQLSSSTSTKDLIDRGTLSTLACSWSADGQLNNQLPVTSTLNDERNRFQFALFAAPVSGPVQISCSDVPAVFVDDADHASPDWSALLLVVATIGGLVGAIMAVSGGYQLTE